MIRGWACVFLILVASLAAIHNPPSLHASFQTRASHTDGFPLLDPNATLTAFNYTYAQADLYTKSSPLLTFSPNATGTRFDWLNTVPRTTNGSQVQGSAFRFNVTKSAPPTGLEAVNWTLTIPKFNCINCSSTIVRFAFFGSLTKGTSANYTLTLSPFNRTVVRTGNNTGPGDFPTILSLSCPAPNVCIDVTRYIGFTLTLAFRFGWNSSQIGMLVEVGELIVGSLDQTFKNSISNSMILNSTKVTHTTKLAPIIYNSTVTYPNGTKTGNITHTWSTEILNIYYPAGYNITQILLNSTVIYPVAPRVAFDRASCNNGPCSVSLLALNMSDLGPPSNPFSRNSTLVIRATSPNTISVRTLAGTAPVDYFLPGENVTVKVDNSLKVVNASIAARTGRLNITFVDPNGSNTTIPPKSIQTSTGGLFSYILSAGFLNPFGQWNITVSFINNFDMGLMFHTFRVQQIQLTPGSFSYAGSNSLLTVKGNLTYMPNLSPAVGVNGTVLAMDAAAGRNPITTTSRSSTGLYISNITLLNGIFTTGNPLRMFFTIVNPGTQGFNATVTIEHEWPGSVPHGVRATFSLDPADQPFIFGPAVYQADVFLLSGGVQLQVTSLTSHNAKTVTLSLGLSPVLSSRQHSGLFKLTINSTRTGSGSFFNSLESPVYGYVLAPGFIPGKFLAFSKPFTTRPDGTFSTTFTSARILGAQKLVLLVLARDGNGIVLGNQDPTIQPPDSTLLLSSLDSPSEVGIKQSVALKLHLTNNSTKITFNLTINLDLSGSGIVASQVVTLPPRRQQDLPFTFPAPSSPSVYTLTFSSPEYGTPFLTKTLQVSLVQSNLQILIPLVIGLVAALVILGFYMVRKSPEVVPETKEKQRGSPGKPSKPQTGQPGAKSLTRT